MATDGQGPDIAVAKIISTWKEQGRRDQGRPESLPFDGSVLESAEVREGTTVEG